MRKRPVVPHDHATTADEYLDSMSRIYDVHMDDLLNVTFQVTEDCNLRCTYCYQIAKSPKHMSIETAKKAVELILTDPKLSHKIGCSIEFIGGEPFLEIDLIRETYEYFLKRCIELNHPFLYRHRIHLSTNGVLYLTDKVQDFIKAYEDSISIGITIDGPKELHDACRLFPNGTGSFDIVERAVREAVREERIATTKVTLARENLHHLGTIVKYFHEDLGIHDIPTNVTFEGPWDMESARLLYQKMIEVADYCYENDTYSEFCISLFDELGFCPTDYTDPENNENWCGGTGKMIAIDPDGKCFPCLRYTKSSIGDSVPLLVIGDVDNGLWNRECEKCIINELQSITATSQSTDECINCPISAGCAWCSAWNYQCTGQLNKRVTEICIMHKASSLANVYYWNRFYEKHNVRNVYENYLPEKDCIEIIGEEEYSRLCDIVSEQRNRMEEMQ